MSALAALAAALSCWLWLSPPPAGRLGHAAEGVPQRWRRPRPGLLAALAVTGALVLGGALDGVAGAAVAGAIAVPVVSAVAVWRRHRSRSLVARARTEVVAACQLLAGLLRVGHVPAVALDLAAREAPILAEPAAAQRIGSPVGPVLLRAGERPGRSGLVELGVAWEVAERTGASLTATLDALSERLSAGQTVQNVVAAELSAPRATGRLLAALPVAGLVLGYGFGGDPVAFLTGSLPGQLSLLLGVSLGCIGVSWTERIAGAGDP